MKKIIFILLIALIFLNGCGNINQIKGTQAEEGIVEDFDETVVDPTENVKVTDNINIEENINAEDISEDIEMTEDAIDNNISEEKTEEDIDTNDKVETETEENIIKLFEAIIPEGMVQNIKYDKYKVYNNYLLILTQSANIRENPSSEDRIVGKVSYMEKIELVAEVKGQYIEKYKSDSWYKVKWTENEEVKYGYIFATLGEVREFQFSKMYEELNALKLVTDNNTMAYITNYKNSKGTAPLHNGSTNDDYGTARHQAAPAYFSASTKSDFRYVADGTLISILGQTDTFYEINTSNFGGIYYVPKKYVSLRNSIKELTKAVIVDRKNQNEAVFEYIDGQWNMISNIYATTGEKAKYKLPTELGYYMAIERRERFLYLDDETSEISGYAPFALRFSGGAYIHGVPVGFVKEDDKLVDPGITEYLFTIGTTPRSHKCVRNYTSHAEFIYSWAEIGKTAVIVIE